MIEVPPGSGPGTVDDAFFRFVIDMGAPGPDRGKGGKYLIVPPDYKGAVPKDKKDGGQYFVARSPSYVNLVVLRGFLKDGKPDAASKLFREGFKVYSLSKAANPPKMEFINASKVPFNTVHANDFEFFHELDHVIQKEPLDLFEPELRGLAAAHRHPQGQEVRARCADEGDSHRRRRGRQRHRPGDLLPQPRSARLRSTRTASGGPASSATITAGSTATACPGATRTHARTSSTSPPSTRRRWPRRSSAGARNTRSATPITSGDSVRRRKELQDERPQGRPGEGLLVGGALRPADALRAADPAAVTRARTTSATS